MREYETIFILRPDLAPELIQKVQDKVEKALNENKSQMIEKKDWGKRKLAYRIEKQPYGQYFYYNYSDNGQVITALERALKLDENVMRFMTVKLSDESEPDSKNVEKINALGEGGFIIDDGSSRPPRGDRRGPRKDDRGFDRGFDRGPFREDSKTAERNAEEKTADSE